MWVTVTYISRSSDFSSFIFALKNSLVLLAKHDSGELRCPVTAPIVRYSYPFRESIPKLWHYFRLKDKISLALKFRLLWRHYIKFNVCISLQDTFSLTITWHSTIISRITGYFVAAAIFAFKMWWTLKIGIVWCTICTSLFDVKESCNIFSNCKLNLCKNSHLYPKNCTS